MMNILIVGKTRMKTGCCIGAISLDNGVSLRLLEVEGSNPPKDTVYKIGQVWSIEFIRHSNPIPPHTEDILVTERNLIGFEQNISNVILEHMQPHRGSISGLYNGLLNFTSNGSGYISVRTTVPAYSTWFWVPDKDLNIEREANKVRYTYYDGGVKKLAYVGFDITAPQTIPRGTLIRVSLARWWSPDDLDMEDRCYLQLSGWY